MFAKIKKVAFLGVLALGCQLMGMEQGSRKGTITFTVPVFGYLKAVIDHSYGYHVWGDLFVTENQRREAEEIDAERETKDWKGKSCKLMNEERDEQMEGGRSVLPAPQNIELQVMCEEKNGETVIKYENIKKALQQSLNISHEKKVEVFVVAGLGDAVYDRALSEIEGSVVAIRGVGKNKLSNYPEVYFKNFDTNSNYRGLLYAAVLTTQQIKYFEQRLLEEKGVNILTIPEESYQKYPTFPGGHKPSGR